MLSQRLLPQSWLKNKKIQKKSFKNDFAKWSLSLGSLPLAATWKYRRPSLSFSKYEEIHPKLHRALAILWMSGFCQKILRIAGQKCNLSVHLHRKLLRKTNVFFISFRYDFPTAESSLKVYEREIKYPANFLLVHTVAIRWKTREQMGIKLLIAINQKVV